MQPNLSIVVVSWNTCDLLKACLTSVFENAGDLRLEVFVVDNASTDESPAMVRKCFPQVRLIENKTNVGFAAANNLMFSQCSADFVLLLNSDTIVVGNALQILVEFMRANPTAAAVGPRLLHPRLQLKVLGCGYQPTLWHEFNHQFGLSQLFPYSKLFRGVHLFTKIHDDRVREVEWISGACLLVRKSIIQQVGGLDERFFMYAEDMEWCRRILQAGSKLYSVPQAIVEHHLSASTRKRDDAALLSVAAGRSYFAYMEKPSRLKLLLYDFICTCGNLLRTSLFFFRSLTDAQHSEMWRSRARLFASYARTHISFFGKSPEKGESQSVN